MRDVLQRDENGIQGFVRGVVGDVWVQYLSVGAFLRGEDGELDLHRVLRGVLDEGEDVPYVPSFFFAREF